MTGRGRSNLGLRWSAAGLAWGLWALTLPALAATAWLDHLLRQAGASELTWFRAAGVPYGVAAVSAATVGAVLASRRPAHPVGWLLLALGLSLNVTGVVYAYPLWAAGATGRAAGGGLPGRVLQRHRRCLAVLCRLRTAVDPDRGAALAALALVGQSRRRRRRAVAAGGDPQPRSVELSGSIPDRRQPAGPPGSVRAAGHHRAARRCRPGGRAGGGGGLAGRPVSARPRGAAPAASLAGVRGRGGCRAVAGRRGHPGAARRHALFQAAVGSCVALLPLATGAAILQYRLYDLDRIISRTLAYGLLTILLSLAYALVVVGLGRLLPHGSSLVVAGATLAVAAVFQPARRRVQAVVDRRFNRRRYDAAQLIEAFSARLRDEVDLDTLSGELLQMIEQTVQPTRASLWLRPQALSTTAARPASRRSPTLG